jgi:hypothetical protein
MMYDPCTDGRPDYFDVDGDHPFADGLKFLGAGRFPESKYFHDSSLYGNHGTLTTMSVPATATSGWVWDSFLGRWAIRYDEINDYIQLPVLNGGNSFSVVAWCNIMSSVASRIYIFSGSSAEATSLEGFLNPSSGLQTFLLNGNYINHDWGDTASIQGWHVFSWIYTGVRVWLGRDGVFVDKGAFATTPNWTYAQHIGCSGTHSGLFGGQISDYLISSPALSTTVISQIAEPSNTTLSGLLLRPARRIFAAAAAATGNRRRRVLCTGA